MARASVLGRLLISRVQGGPAIAVILVLLAAMVLSGRPFPAAAQTGIPCNPEIRFDNPECPQGTVCRRFSASCWGLGLYCNDPPAENRAAVRWAEGVCDAICTDGFGRCENRVRPCNTNAECSSREQCFFGLCTYVPGRCATDADCGEGQRCQGVRCVATGDGSQPAVRSCTSDGDCRAGEACRDAVCLPTCEGEGTEGTGCPPGSGCYEGVCQPL